MGKQLLTHRGLCDRVDRFRLARLPTGTPGYTRRPRNCARDSRRFIPLARAAADSFSASTLCASLRLFSATSALRNIESRVFETSSFFSQRMNLSIIVVPSHRFRPAPSIDSRVSWGRLLFLQFPLPQPAVWMDREAPVARAQKPDPNRCAH